MNYSFQPLLADGKMTLHITLEFKGGPDGNAELELPSEWAGQTHLDKAVTDLKAVCQRRRCGECGRVSSWVDEKLERCFQLMEAEDRKHLDEWIGNWNDLVEFEIYPVISSKEAAERVSSLL